MKENIVSDKLVTKIIQVAFHRNGVGGMGFHAVVFESENEECAKCHGFATLATRYIGPGNTVPARVCTACNDDHGVVTKTQRMLGIVFDKVHYVSVLDIDMLADTKVGVAFGENSYRGDNYEPLLRAAIANTDSDGSYRLGPFAIPTKRKTKS